MYHKCLDFCLKAMKNNKEKGNPRKVSVMAATHNEDTVRYAIDK